MTGTMIGLMLIVLVAAITLCFYIGLKRTGDKHGALAIGCICAGIIALVWFIVAIPASNYNRNNCARKAEGYGLEAYDWSIRLECRVYLPSGQLVPENRIRITSDGRIIITED